MIVERRSKKGRTFYGCANYPNCDFVSWDRVIPQPCPVCGSYVIAKTRRGGNVLLECAANKEHDVSSLRPKGSDESSEEPTEEREPVEV
jgi:ssDNA-binding Zn-finger/Zn-ribbon topoisomerase 1